MLHKSWTEIGTVPARQQHLAFGHLGILITDHLKLQVRSNAVERDWRMLAEIRGAKSSQFFTPITDEIKRPLERRSRCQSMRKLDYCRGARSIVVSAVINGIAIYRRADSEVIEMRRQQKNFRVGARVLAGQYANSVVAVSRRVFRLKLQRDGRSVLQTRQLITGTRREWDHGKSSAHRAAGASGEMRMNRTAFRAGSLHLLRSEL